MSLYEINEKRINAKVNRQIGEGPVLYWMTRDQRVDDNWSLIYALNLGYKLKQPVFTVFNLVDEFLDSQPVHFQFMLEGLAKLCIDFQRLNIGFKIIKGNPKEEIPAVIKKLKASILISDFDPLKIKRNWQDDVADKTTIPFHIVDTHNIVPCCYASDKQEFAAYTIRPKIHKNLREFMDDLPDLLPYEHFDPALLKISDKTIDPKTEMSGLPDSNYKIRSGPDEALDTLRIFLKDKLAGYAEKRNDPSLGHISGLSPYLHFGQIAAQRVALEVSSADAPREDKKAFLEELIVRKELSDNYCYYNKNYDNFDGFPEWAQKTLNKHREDKRKYLYTPYELEDADTHDKYWNAAQIEMVKTGKMHGYMRMYWAKKILEWSRSPEEAQEAAIYLNDKYELDGRDPNGYTGIAWAIGGVHDRAWTESLIFGKIRYMNDNGLKRKFNIDEYVKQNM